MSVTQTSCSQRSLQELQCSSWLTLFFEKAARQMQGVTIGFRREAKLVLLAESAPSGFEYTDKPFLRQLLKL